MIDKNKKYRTRDGREVRILMTDGGGWHYPVIAAYKDHAGRWWPLHLTKHGTTSLIANTPNDLDLIEVRPRIKREVWVNVYPEESGIPEGFYFSKSAADASSCHRRIACVKLTIDVEEGEGL